MGIFSSTAVMFLPGRKETEPHIVLTSVNTENTLVFVMNHTILNKKGLLLLL